MEEGPELAQHSTVSQRIQVLPISFSMAQPSVPSGSHDGSNRSTGTWPQAGRREQGLLTHPSHFIGEENLSPKHVTLFPLLSLTRTWSYSTVHWKVIVCYWQAFHILLTHGTFHITWGSSPPWSLDSTQPYGPRGLSFVKVDLWLPIPYVIIGDFRLSIYLVKFGNLYFSGKSFPMV